MNIKAKSTALTISSLLLGAAIGGCAVAAYPQPHMLAARHALQAARYQLSIAAHNKGGHRVAALRAVDAALVQVNQGIRFGSYH
jgi:hypothetical protein